MFLYILVCVCVCVCVWVKLNIMKYHKLGYFSEYRQASVYTKQFSMTHYYIDYCAMHSTMRKPYCNGRNTNTKSRFSVYCINIFYDSRRIAVLTFVVVGYRFLKKYETYDENPSDNEIYLLEIFSFFFNIVD